MKVIRSIRRVAPSLNDADLVLAARSGEPWAREALIERHCQAAHRLAFVLLGPHGGSRNAVETAFRRSFADLPALRDPSGFARLLTRHTVATVEAQLRRARRPFTRERPDFMGFRSQQALVPDQDERLALTLFYETIEQLPVRARLAWLLREVERTDLWDIANLLRISKARARRSLELAERRVRPIGSGLRVPTSLAGHAGDLPIPLSEFERAQLHRRVEQLLATRNERRYWPWALGAVALSALVSVGVVLVQGQSTSSASEITPVAAQQNVELPDGTRARLSLGAELRVSLADAQEVRLALLSGRAEFDVVQSSGKRFFVNVGAASVAALGPRLSIAVESVDPSHRSFGVRVATSGGPAELWRRGDGPSILLGAEESWSGRVPLVEH